MDLIRIFIDTAFSRIAERYLRVASDTMSLSGAIMIDENLFVDECRLRHPELSDDQIKTIYFLYRDEWALSESPCYGYDEGLTPNIFNVLFRFSKKMLRMSGKMPEVRFRHLFRWREVTQLIGEDIMVAAFMASENLSGSNAGLRYSDPQEDRYSIDFCSWPTVLHNDNIHLHHIFENHGLAELHSHLKASTDHFSINWVYMMNHVVDLKGKLDRMMKSHDPSRGIEKSEFLHQQLLFAAFIRLNIWRFIRSGEDDGVAVFEEDFEMWDAFHLQRLITENTDDNGLDYIPVDAESPMRVFAGERRFLYAVCDYILRGKELKVSRMFYRYLLIKHYVRSFFVQVNDNNGFANFKRFQDQKSHFLSGPYRGFLHTLPIWEAARFNYVSSMETRVAPIDRRKESKALMKEIREIESRLSDSDNDNSVTWSLIFHFIKRGEIDTEDGAYKFSLLAKKIRSQTQLLKDIVLSDKWRNGNGRYLSRINGIDAASSEIGCRPEVFAQAFRYLKSVGFASTFHVGEDFYDIVDGLRAIDEALLFLGLEAGDRLGHALALGISPEEFYSERHYTIALPAQWMLDNVTWLYFKCREFNIRVSPKVEDFLLTTFRYLIRWIGYDNATDTDNTTDIHDYYQSMRLRGDNPEVAKSKESVVVDDRDWDEFNWLRDEESAYIRRYNSKARRLHCRYLFDEPIKKAGRKIRSFRLPEDFAIIIRQLQEVMIRIVSAKQIGIECCPSSNVRIGYFHRFDQHPILRFFPVEGKMSRYPLGVSINTDDLGVFSTSLPNEYSLMALALLKMKDSDGKHLYSSETVYKWIESLVENSHKFLFRNRFQV